jgi:hypothetical protein
VISFEQSAPQPEPEPDPEPDPEPAAFAPPEPEPQAAFEQSAPQPEQPPAGPDADAQMVIDMLRGYAEDITGLSARLDRFGSNAPAASEVAREQADALSRIASELLAKADELS